MSHLRSISVSHVPGSSIASHLMGCCLFDLFSKVELKFNEVLRNNGARN